MKIIKIENLKNGESVFSTPKSLSTNGKFLQKRKLTDRTVKTYVYTRSPVIRKTIGFNIATDSEKLQFEQKCQDLQARLDCKSTKDVIMKLIMDYNVDSTPTHHVTFIIPADFMNKSAESGITAKDPASNAREYFIGQYDSLFKLLHDFAEHSQRCGYPLTLQNKKHSGHVLCLSLVCEKKHICNRSPWLDFLEMTKNSMWIIAWC